MATDRLGSTPEQIQADTLLRECLIGRPDKARKAQKRLFELVNGSPTLNLGIHVFAQALSQVLVEKDITAAKRNAGFIEALATEMRNGDRKLIDLTGQTLREADEILGREASVEQKAQFIPQIGRPYKLVAKLCEIVNNEKEKGVGRVEVFVISSTDEYARAHSQWEYKLFAAYRDSYSDNDLSLTQIADRLAALLQEEPPNPSGETSIWEKEFGGISLSQVVRLEGKLSLEQARSINTLFAQLLHDKRSFKEVWGVLFLGSHRLNSTVDGKVAGIKNERLLANLNQWQAHFLMDVIGESGQELDADSISILAQADNQFAISIMHSLWQHLTHPMEMDPDYNIGSAISMYLDDANWESYPLFNAAVTWFKRQNTFKTSVYISEIGEGYLDNHALPAFKAKIAQLGLSEKFEPGYIFISDALEKLSYEKNHILTLMDVFKKNAGEIFIEKLAGKVLEIEEVTSTAWESTDFHFLPMKDGINKVDFSPGSVPNLLGIESLLVHRTGDGQDWEINLSFLLAESGICILGKIDQKGTLDLTVPLKEKIPGLEEMLRYIAIMTVHDLAVQAKSEHLASSSQKSRPKLVVNADPSSVGVSNLPRVQTDRGLVDHVYKITGIKPRRVELHKQYLRGARVYENLVMQYEEAQAAGNTEDAMAALDLINEHRDKMFNISEEKRTNIPAKLELAFIVDPETGQERVLQTWVVEHTSPRPTDDELASPVKMYQRHYKNTSALASLDQLKPWFLGL